MKAYVPVTEETSQVPMGWLKEEAPSNMPPMQVTDETSQESRGWLKEEASENMEYM